jgi:uncharacterized membrane protein
MSATVRRLPGPLQALVSRRHLMAGALAGLLFFLFATPWMSDRVTRGLLAWDVCTGLFILLSLATMIDVDPERMKVRACDHDYGRRIMLAVPLVAAVMSLAAIVMELGAAKGQGRLHEAFSVTLTASTIILSWFFVHLIFALHYAHAYYVAEQDSPHKGGLDFPGDDEPDYWDFLHFSLVIGATSQTADITFTSKDMRRLGTIHCMIAFAFNTAILATMINLAAGLF